MKTIVAVTFALLCGVGVLEAGDLKQTAFNHTGACDGTYHVVPFLTNDRGAPIRVVQGMLLNTGTGGQNGYIARRSDGFFFSPSGYLNMPPIHQFRSGDAVVIAPGDGLQFVHWCSPPDHYFWWVLVDYTE